LVPCPVAEYQSNLGFVQREACRVLWLANS
jgi:hypothetical protein